ncbi:Insulinase (Peptidase family M16) family protein [Rhynchospora pubera]|uniref:Insulinase (Peptidase family M16) family protein n=1 Tax=Rhynchospora pubera TaxID=906938 RepID=A0AAV8F920_9POAL|nr:Insulinase (Peptidase family M16) family protein [Rhynchospora pubera]
MAMERSEVEIVKPRNDKREYRRIVLPNSLEVCLISDPDTDKAAASMNVDVGSFCDPEGLEGLAHFLEHMLFYASEKYPVEDSYSKFIAEHGGTTNAFTSSENTNFFFDVNADCLEEALDRFAQFFIKPLMSADATIREIKAVDSEHQKNLLTDVWRINQLEKHLSSRDHPYHKFSTGSWETLEVRPKAKGLDTRLELLKFYENNYSANLMQLVVYAKENLDVIQSLVESKFVAVRNISRNPFDFSGNPCPSEHLQILVKAVPIKDCHKLKIFWPITPGMHHYKEGPCGYLSHLIGHEGEGSLFSVLKKLGWAISLVAGEEERSYAFSFFYTIIELTDAGQEHIEEIVGLLFKYIKLLQDSGVQKWIFDELVAIRETGFHYKDKIPPIHYALDVALNMQLYPPEDWLVGSSVPSKFSPDTIQKILNELTPSNVRIFCQSKKFEGCTNLTEPWYGTQFAVEKLDIMTLEKWVEKAPDVNLSLPKENVFIPTDLSLKNVQEKVRYPRMLRKSPFSRLWYKPDTNFFTPKAYIRIDFNCPESKHSPEASVLTEMFTRLVMDYLNEYAYDADVAGLSYGIKHTDTGFEIICVGYNHKMRVLLDKIISKIDDFEVRPDRFSVIKESLQKEYENYKFHPPYRQAMYYCSLLLEEHSWPWSEELEVLQHLEPNHLLQFTPRLLGKTHLECYISGNIEPKEAESTVEHIEEVLFKASNSPSKQLFPSQHATKRIVKLQDGLRYYYAVEGSNPSDENSSIVNYIQVHQDDMKMNVKLQLVALVAKQPAFHQLRSIEQLGYIALLRQRNDHGVHGLQFIIQSTVKDPSYLDARVNAFLGTFESTLYEMSDDEFKSNVNALIDLKLEKHKNLREEAAFFWKEISDGTLLFDRKESEVGALRELKKEELVEFFNSHVKFDAPQRRNLSVQVYGGLHQMEYKHAIDNLPPGSCQITDIFSFRRSRPLYGSFRAGQTRPGKI